MRDALAGATPEDLARVQEMMSALNDMLDADARGEHTQEQFDEFMRQYGEFFPERPQNLAELIGYGMVAGPDTSLLTQPSRAIKRALEANDMTARDVDLFELNEAFAAVGIASMHDLGISDDIVNVNGGAIALGHPVGMSGARVVLTIINELRRRGGGVGAAALCGGGGQGDAAIIRTL